MESRNKERESPIHCQLRLCASQIKLGRRNTIKNFGLVLIRDQAPRISDSIPYIRATRARRRGSGIKLDYAEMNFYDIPRDGRSL